jgi:hypothetical protein
MKAGDLIQRRRLLSKPKSFGVLLDDPIFPSFGNYPMRYRVLTHVGVEEWVDEHKVVVEVVK